MFSLHPVVRWRVVKVATMGGGGVVQINFRSDETKKPLVAEEFRVTARYGVFVPCKSFPAHRSTGTTRICAVQTNIYETFLKKKKTTLVKIFDRKTMSFEHSVEKKNPL